MDNSAGNRFADGYSRISTQKERAIWVNIYAIKDSRKKEDLDKYFCFNGKDLDQESFVQSLRNLVTEYNNLKS